jgi:hypothetical protein
MRRKRILILVLILVLLPAICWADEYVLVMSKDDNVCQHMLNIYNEDLRQYGEVKYDADKEFTTIRWEGKKYYRMIEGKKEYPAYSYSDNIVRMSKFDINNDGKEEIVIKDKGMLRSNFTESLYYFKNEDSGYFKEDEFDIKILYTKATGAVGTGGFKGNTYALKELPQILEVIGGKEVKLYHVMGGWFYVNPFVFKEVYYMSMRDDDPSDIKKFSVILKYTKDNQLKDICYYLKAVDCKNKNQRRK